MDNTIFNGYILWIYFMLANNLPFGCTNNFHGMVEPTPTSLLPLLVPYDSLLLHQHQCNQTTVNTSTIISTSTDIVNPYGGTIIITITAIITTSPLLQYIAGWWWCDDMCSYIGNK